MLFGVPLYMLFIFLSIKSLHKHKEVPGIQRKSKYSIPCSWMVIVPVKFATLQKSFNFIFFQPFFTVCGFSSVPATAGRRGKAAPFRFCLYCCFSLNNKSMFSNLRRRIGSTRQKVFFQTFLFRYSMFFSVLQYRRLKV